MLLDPRWRMLVAIGFCGSYTTFSSYAFESFAQMESGQWMMMAINITANNALCLGAIILGAAWREECKMTAHMAVQVTMYLTEGDSWHRRPLHLEVLRFLREENVAGAVAFHSVAGFRAEAACRQPTWSRRVASCLSWSPLSTPTSMSRVFCRDCARWRRTV